MTAPVSAVAGYFPSLPETPKPNGGPVPDREQDRDGHHGVRRRGRIRRWQQCTEHRIDGSWVYAVSP